MTLKFEDLKDLKYGDEIIIQDPLMGGATPYALMSNDNDAVFHFIGGPGASLMIKEQATIDGFHVEKIDETHEAWDQFLSDHAKQVGEMLTKFIEGGLDNIIDY